MRQSKAFFVKLILPLLIGFLPACSTIHTGALIGDIPLPYGRCVEGEIYKDPSGRFEVPCPPNSVKTVKEEGVSFNVLDMLYESVLVFNSESDFDAIFQAYQENSAKQKVTYEIEKNEKILYRQYEARDLRFLIKVSGKNSGINITRFIKTPNFLYWVHYSSLVTDEIRGRNVEEAEKFFDSIRF